MKRLLNLAIGLCAVVAILMGGLAPQAHAEGKFGKYKSEVSLGQVQFAAKKAPTPNSVVSNFAGDDVKIKDSRYANTYRYLIEKPKADTTREWSTIWNDVPSSFRSRADKRCINWDGPGATDGLWKLEGNTWVSMPTSGVIVKVFAFSKCSGVSRYIDQAR